MIKRKHLIFLSTSLLIVLIASVGAYLFYQRKGLLETSTVLVSEEDNQLVISFKIVPKDIEEAQQLSADLGVDNSWQQGIKLSLDDSTLNLLKPNLPVSLKLEFKPKEVDFSSFGMTVLNSGLSGKDYNFATGSGSLRLNAANNSNFSLKIENPADLLKESTKSSGLFLSNQLGSLVNSSDKVGTIELKVSSGNVSGDIRMK